MIHDTVIIRDTNFVHDTTFIDRTFYDTVLIHDTSFVHDTTFIDRTVHDTMLIHDTTFIDRTVHDTMLVNLYLRDFVIYHDLECRGVDTIWMHDIIIDCHDQQLYIIADNDTMGACSGSGTFPLGSEVQIMAIPNQGFRFLRWDDGNTENPRTIVLDRSMQITAIFEQEY